MTRPTASVLIPTHNPGPAFRLVLDAVFAQRTEFAYEVIVVDSESSGADIQLMRQYPVQLHGIAKADFGHGKTRNHLARLARGEFLLYLSQDAVPANATWLATLVRPLVQPHVAGAY